MRVAKWSTSFPSVPNPLPVFCPPLSWLARVSILLRRSFRFTSWFFLFFYQRDFFSTRKEISPSESFINKFKNLNSLSLLFRDRSLKFPNFISGSARKIKIREEGRQMGLLMREIICRKYGKKRWRGREGKKGGNRNWCDRSAMNNWKSLIDWGARARWFARIKRCIR